MIWEEVSRMRKVSVNWEIILFFFFRIMGFMDTKLNPVMESVVLLFLMCFE